MRLSFLFIVFFLMLSISAQNFESQLKELQQYTGSPAVPQVSTHLLISANSPENIALKEMLLKKPANPQILQGKRIAMLSEDGAEEIEIIGCIQYLKNRGAQVDVVAPKFIPFPAKFGVLYPAQRETHILMVRFMENASWMKIDRFLDDIKTEEYDAVIIPGGAWNPDILRHNSKAQEFVREMYAKGKLAASICHGPLVFINAGILKNKKATGYWNIQIDLKNAGAEVLEQPVVIDGNMITSRFIFDLPCFLKAIEEALLKPPVISQNKLINRPLGHVGITVSNIEKSIDWYQKVLGFKLLVGPIDIHSKDPNIGELCSDLFGEKFQKVRIAHMAASNGVGLELFEFVVPETQQDKKEYWKTGIMHISVEDVNVEELAYKIQENGGKIQSKVWKIFPDKECKMVYCQDIDGNIVEIFSHSYVEIFSGK